MNEIIIAIIVVVVLLLILASLFLFTVRRVNVLVKKVFVDKLQEYDFLIDDKEKKIEELNGNIEIKKNEEKELEDLIKKLKEESEDFEKEEIEVVMPKGADYEDGNLLENYKKIKEGFNFDYEEKIKEFIAAEVTEEDSEYNVYMNIRNYFSHKTIYKISTYNNNEQRIIVEGLLTNAEKELVKELIDVAKFNIVKFTNRLDELIKISDPKIYVYVSDKNLKFNDLHKNIETIFDEKMTEGFKVEYKGKIYDYSI